jgi:hypothetical protein
VDITRALSSFKYNWKIKKPPIKAAKAKKTSLEHFQAYMGLYIIGLVEYLLNSLEMFQVYIELRCYCCDMISKECDTVHGLRLEP